jgi:hypothetical protein
VSEVPKERALRDSIEREPPERLVRELFTHACFRGAPATGESLLVAGAVSDLLLSPLGLGPNSTPEAPSAAGTAARHDLAHEILSAAWCYLSLSPQRDLPTKWLRQLPREDRPFLFTRSLEEVVAADSLEDAALRLSAVLRALSEPSSRDALLLEAGAWTPRAIALPATQAAVAATHGANADEARPYWIRILECVYAAGASIPLALPDEVPTLEWADLMRDWPEDPDACAAAWVDRPRWSRALEMAEKKSSSVRWALVRQLESADRARSAAGEKPLAGLDPWTCWMEEREQGRTSGALEALRTGRPLAFLCLVGLCTMREQAPGIDPQVLLRT